MLDIICFSGVTWETLLYKLYGVFHPEPPLFLEDISVFPKMVVPPKHPKMIIFSRKTPWLLGKPTILGTPHISTNQKTVKTT